MRPALIPEALLEERRRLGHDRFDEVWEGVLHMVPFPTPHHQRVELDLAIALKPVADRRGLQLFEGVGLYDPSVTDDSDYRGPDILIVDERHLSVRGVEGNAHVVVEIVSPHDESRQKLPFYARIGVREVWLLDARAPSLELLVRRDAGYMAATIIDGTLRSTALDVELAIVDGVLRVTDRDEVATVELRPSIPR